MDVYSLPDSLPETRRVERAVKEPTMDITQLLTAIPQPWQGILLFALALVSAAATASTFLPQAKDGTVYAYVLQAIHWLGMNFGKAANKTPPVA